MKYSVGVIIICVNKLYFRKHMIGNLLDSPDKVLKLISDYLEPKHSEKKEFGEVFTPMDFVYDKQLKDIEIHWHKSRGEDIWTNEKLTWYEPTVGVGNYMIAIYYKLLEGLKYKIPNEADRKKHIIETQLYMGELNKSNCNIVKSIFNTNDEYNLNLYEGDTLNIDLFNTFGVNTFDIIIGNPPYNEKVSATQTCPRTLYTKYIEEYINKCKLLSYIIPSKWFSNNVRTDKFRVMMLNRTDIVYIRHYDDATQIFSKGVDINGGVNYFLIDSSYNGLCNYNGVDIKLNAYDILTDSKYYDLIDKLKSYEKVTKYYQGQHYYNIETNDKRVKDVQTADDYKCYMGKQKGFVKYIDKKVIKRKMNDYNVITTRSSHGSKSGFGNMFVGYPNEVYSDTYIAFTLNTKEEAESLYSYLKCKLPNLMLSLRKMSQHISKPICEWIPLVPLNKQWTDNEIYAYFNLSEDNIKLIKETQISGYK